MPLVQVRVMENVLTDGQKTQIAQEFTDTLLKVIGEPVRGVTTVIVDDIASGQLTIGGQKFTTDLVKGLLAKEPVAAK